MFIYIIILTLLILLHLFENRFSQKQKKYAVIFVVGFIIIIQGLRSLTVGVDVLQYNNKFNQFGNEEIKWTGFDSEYLYKILNKIIYVMGLDFRVLLFIVSMSIFIPLGYISYKYSEKPMLSILLFVLLGFFAFSLSGLRQTIAIGLTLISYKYIREKKVVRFLILVFLAAGFHKSAYIFLIAYPLHNIKMLKTYFLIIIPMVILIFIFRKPIYDSLYYLYDDYYVPVETNAYNFLLMLISFYILSIVLFWEKKDRYLFGLNNLLLMAVIIQVFATYSEVVMRFGYYFYIYLILLIPEQIKTIKDSGFRNLYKWFVIVFLSITFLLSIKGNIMKIYPYRFLHNTSLIVHVIQYR